ncbi:MAG: dicarboxylate/amino acid:cation symporter [Planctomycetota bacterium]|nr:dicarboxylate/amino acid:cation symporter [Planctomycetota bacterium]
MKLKLHHQILIAMALGAGIGLPLNITSPLHSLFELDASMRADLDAAALAESIRAGLEQSDPPEPLNPPELSKQVQDKFKEKGTPLSKDVVVTKPDKMRWIVRDRGAGRQYTVIRQSDNKLIVYEPWPHIIARYGKGVGDLFLQLLKMIVAPLILTSLVTGVTGTGNIKGLGRLGGRTMVYYISTSMIAIITGIIMVNILKPGVGADLAKLEAGKEAVSESVAAADRGVGEILWDQLFTLIPANPFSALADPTNTSILDVIFFALLFGVFITIVGGDAGTFLTKFFSSAFDVMMRMTMFLIRFAPIGVLGFMLYASAGKGVDVFIALGWYMLTVALALSFHAFITLPLLLLLLARRSPWAYFRSMSPALLTAFSTASSNGTLPLTMNCVEKNAGVSNRISSFVLPLGATINMDGTALYEAVAVLFIAQAYGFDLGMAQQAIVAITALLASVGAAGIPHAGTVMMVVVLGAVGLPLDAVGLILAVDRILDMYRTSINVWSDSTACAVVERFEPAGQSTTAMPRAGPDK